MLLLGWVSLLGAGAALADTLVSNADQAARGGNIDLITTEVAQAFTTGSNATGYTLTAVKLEFGSGRLASFPDSGDTITVKITDGLTATSSTVATLTSPVTWSSTSTFTAPASTSLMASTTYYVVVEGGSGSAHTTTSASEDSGGPSGWTIANALEFRGTVSSGSLRTWRTGSQVLRITIEGDTVFNAAADARLDTLAVADATLSPRFGPGTTSYTAVVANSVSQGTITATTRQSAATVEYLDGSNSTLTDADSTADGFQVPLSVGRNTVKVKVTASDTTTTKTFTVTIFRTTATVTSCSANAMVNQVWTGQLVAEPGGSLVGYSESRNEGTLSDTTFSYNGNTYNIQSISVFPGAHLSILLDAGLGTDTSDLTLHVGTQEYAFDDAISQTTGGYSWTSNPPSWSDADAICLALTEVDGTAPTLTGISTRQNNWVVLAYDETIDDTSNPDKSAFEVKVGGVARTVSSVSIGTAGVSLRLGSAFRPGDTLTVSYTVPGTGPIQDAAGNDAAGFTDEAVDNTLAATAPDAPGNLAARAGGAESIVLSWETPWANGDDITKFQARYITGSNPGGTFADIDGSSATTTTHTVTELTSGREYTFEVRAVNGIGNGAEATVMRTTATPAWELTITDSNGSAVTELVEGGATATVTVRITNGVTFSTAQTVTLEWDGLALDATSPIQGAGGASAVTIPPGQSRSGTLVISAPDPGGVAAYDPPRTAPFRGMHGEDRLGDIDLTLRDDEDPPVATLTAQPSQVSEGEAIEVEVRLSLPYGGNATSTLQLIVTDAAGALVAPLPTGAQFDAGELTHAITLTAADNAVHNDARVVTVALAPSPDATLYTLGAPSSATVVVADNDNVAPVFSDGASATRSVAENTAAGENVGAALTATDTDAGDTLTYTLEGADAASFDIVSASGQIRTRPGVTYDHEARSSYSVTVKADDGNAGTATIAVTITVTDVAEPPAAPAAPAVTATSASTTSVDVAWTAPANPGKPAISGYDLRYRVGNSGSWTDGPQNRTGASASIASLTAGTSYQVQVRATNAEGDGPWSDSGTGSTGTASNAAPTFANPTAARSVPENSAADTNVGAVVTATDTDAGDTLAYTLEGADAASFDIVSTSGQIRTRPGVTYDHEARSSYSVTVKADDGNAGTATVAVTITVTDVAEPPAAPAAPAVTATSASTTSVDVTWTAPANPGKPAISGYDLRYRAGTGGSWTDGPQNLTGASASIASLTAGTSYQVQVRATNAEGDGPWSASGTGSTGTASNTAPTFANPTAARSVPENSAADTNVGAVVTATDTDAGDTLAYTLEGADAASFDIVSTSGQIRTRPGVTYDHEARSSYSVTVKADDGNAGTATVAVTITVTDVAEPPAAPSAPTVTATSASTTSVDVAWTAPANPGKPAISGYDLRYRVGTGGSWTDGPQNRPGASASIASLTAGTSYQVQVRATNAEGDGPWSASGSGSTGTASNAAPTFANPTAARSVPENSAADTNVGAVVTATDTDAGDTLTYTLEGAGAASFDIVSTSGQIRTRPGVTYDHEARSSYSVTVKADDGNAGTATVAVTITVTDVAEPPAAPAAPAVTATSASTTSVDVTWTAPANPGKPAISGYDLRYRAGTGGSWTDGPQNRPGASASIASLTAGTSYQVQVRATNAEGDGPWSDSGTGSTGTSSNAAPTFANPTAARSVPENSAAGTNVGAVVTATDTDAGDTLTYTLEGAGAASFDIVSTSGQIRTRPGVTYDHEARSSYSVTVKADDGNAGTATVAVTITVTDVAEPPAAPAAPAVTATSASTTSVDVAWTAPANPGKPAISGYDLRYRAGTGGSWTDGPQNRPGASASIASLTAGTSYQVQVRATNAEGDGPWSASGTGSTGTSSNAAPTFANPTATRSVPENSAAGTNVGAVVTATDTDAGDTLTYTLEGAGAASFDIVSTSGQIRTRPGVTYDHEARSSYSVTVKADDGNAGTATVAVTITVTDVAEPPAAPAAPAVTATSASTTSLDVSLDRAGQPGQAGHQRLRPALPGGHRRELDRRPAGPDRRERQHREPDRRHLLPGAGARHQRRGRRPLVRLGQREHRHLEQHRPGCAAVADRGRREPGGDAEVACAGVERRERDPAIPVPATVRVPGLWRLDGHRGQCSGGGQCEQLHRDGAARQCPVPIRGAGGEHRRPRRGIERGRRNTGASQRAPCVAESVDGPVRPNRGDPGRGRDRGPVLGRREPGGDGWRAEPQPERGSRRRRARARSASRRTRGRAEGPEHDRARAAPGKLVLVRRRGQGRRPVLGRVGSLRYGRLRDGRRRHAGRGRRHHRPPRRRRLPGSLAGRGRGVVEPGGRAVPAHRRDGAQPPERDRRKLAHRALPLCEARSVGPDGSVGDGRARDRRAHCEGKRREAHRDRSRHDHGGGRGQGSAPLGRCGRGPRPRAPLRRDVGADEVRRGVGWRGEPRRGASAREPAAAHRRRLAHVRDGGRTDHHAAGRGRRPARPGRCRDRDGTRSRSGGEVRGRRILHRRRGAGPRRA